MHRFADAYVIAREAAFAGQDFEALRTAIGEMKDEVRDNLPRYRDEFIANAEAAGAKVYIARTAADANAYICNLAKERGVKTVVKSKSMASEETHLNHALKDAGVEALETDLGEWIIQLAGERPSHMVMPAIHMLKEEVAELFSKVTGKEDRPRYCTWYGSHANSCARATWMPTWAYPGPTSPIAETGGIALVTNEGNARLTTTLPKIHVALVGMEKLVPTLEDANRIINVLPKNATGQLITSYITWIRGAVPCGDEQQGTAYRPARQRPLRPGRIARTAATHCVASSAGPVPTSARSTRPWAAMSSVTSTSARSALSSPHSSTASKMPPSWSAPASAAAPAWRSARAISTSRASSCTCAKSSARKKASAPASQSSSRM